MKIIKICLSLFMLVISGVQADQANGLVISDGIDWSMPCGTKWSPYSGLIVWDVKWAHEKAREKRYQDGDRRHLAVMINYTWSELNPEKNVFDWKEMDEKIKKITSVPGVGYVFNIISYNELDKRRKKPGIPPWLKEDGVRTLSNGTVIGWEKDSPYIRYYGIFLAEFAKRYANDPNFVGLYMAWLDCNCGEGYLNDGTQLFNMEEFNDKGKKRRVYEEAVAAGFNPESMELYGKSFIDIHADAFKGWENKLAFPNAEINFCQHDKAFEKPSEEIWKYAYSKGIGRRDGGTENWLWHMSSGYGLKYEDGSYLENIEEFAPYNDGRLWYTENEAFADDPIYTQRFGPVSNLKERWFVTQMRAMQVRCNWIWVNGEVYDKTETLLPGFNRWCELQMGKTAKTSPDAWCWLREGYTYHRKKTQAVKNFERWIYQRDIEPDGKTVPADPYDISGIQWVRSTSGTDTEYHARRTDIGNGSKYMYFRVFRDFTGGGLRSSQIKVSYLDGPETRWCIEYSVNASVSRTPAVRAAGSASWKTASFSIPEISFAGAFGGMDFRVVNEGRNDLTIKMLRILKY